MTTVSALLRAEVSKRDPARWVADASLVIERVIPQVWEDTQSPLKAGGVGEIDPSGPNQAYLAVHDRPGVAHPLLRRATVVEPPAPSVGAEARGVWDRLAADLVAAQVIVPPRQRVTRVAGVAEACRATRRIRHTAQRWGLQGQRARDFQPVLEDTAHVLRRVVEHDLAGWLGPRRVGVHTCRNAGVEPRCRVSPVRAKGLCSACYQRALREARCGRDTNPVNQADVQALLDNSAG